MTTQSARGSVLPNNDEQTIVDHLEKHVDFFDRHPATLLRLRLPHLRTGATISLVERQVEVLREKLAGSDARLNEFIQVARANDQLSEKMQRFTRRLLRSTSLAVALQQIEVSLREDFDAFQSVLILSNDTVLTPQIVSERFLRVLPLDDPQVQSFQTLFASGKPRCGQVRDSQRDFLFGDEAVEIGSVALIPLGDQGNVGLLALGSHDRNRFHPGMSTEFLARMGELIADVLNRRNDT